MKRLPVIVILLMVLFSFLPTAFTNDDTANQSQDTGRFQVILTYPDEDRSQMAMNMAAARELKRADDTLNDIYNKVLVKYKDDQEFIDKLTAAQLAWIDFRDAELAAVFPKEDKQRYYGSAFPMSFCIVKAELTWDRVKQLNDWLVGFPEGDLGAGSRRR